MNPFLFKVLLPLGVLGGSAAGAWFPLEHPATPREQPAAIKLPTVRVQTVAPQSVSVTVHSQGVIIPRLEIDLVPQVAGAVIGAHPALALNGFFKWTELEASWGAIALNTTHPRWEVVTWEFVERLRTRMQPLPAGFSLLICASYDTDTCVADRSPLEVQLSAPDTETLLAGASALKMRLARYAGVSDIRDSYRSGKPELNLRLKPEAEGLDLSLQDLSEQVRASFHGIEVQRFLQGQEEVRLIVRSPDAERRSLEHLRDLPIRLASGTSVPLSQVADAVHAPGFGAITRSDRERILTIGARVDRRVGDPEQIYAELEREIFSKLERQYPGLNFHPGKERLAIQATLSAPRAPHRARLDCHLCAHRRAVPLLHPTAHRHGGHALRASSARSSGTCYSAMLCRSIPSSVSSRWWAWC